MSRTSLILLATATLLAGCNKGVEMKNASVEDVAKATKDAHFITPGQWTNETEILSIDMSGVPEAEKPMLAAVTKAMVGKKQSFSNCVSEEEAKRPAAGMFSGGNKGDCTYDSFAMAGGKMDAVMTCKGKGGPGAMNMTLSGTYSDTDYAMNVTMKVSGQGQPAMAFKARNTGKRTGACTKS